MIRTWLLGAALSVAACRAPDAPHVAFLLAAPDADHERYFEARAAERDLRVITLDAGGDHATQIAQVEDVVARGARVVVVQPTDPITAASFVRIAHDQGAKLVAYERPIVAPDVDASILHDTYRAGVLQADAALQATHRRGRYILLAGPANDPTAVEIMRGYKDTLAPYIARGEVEIALEHHHSEWSELEARRSVEASVARSGHPDAILASDAAMARGAVAAVARAGIGPVFVAGGSGEAANLDLVCNGSLAFEIERDIEPLASAAAELARQLIDPTADTDLPTDAANVRVRVAPITPDRACRNLVVKR